MEHYTSLSQSITSPAAVGDAANILSFRPSLTSNSSINYNSNSSIDSCSSSDSEQSDSFSPYYMLSLASKMIDMDEDILLKKHGYTKEETIGSTSQGEIFLANKGEKLVAIKKIPKDLYNEKQCIEDGFTFVTDTDIVKETLILKNIAQKSNPNNKFIIQYLDSFESDDDYYLVTEYIEESITLKDFVIKAHEYILKSQLKLKSYKKSIKFILYQLAAAINLLHNVHKCCHFNISPENILLKQSDFMQTSDNSIIINPNIQIKLKSFGFSEQFAKDTFECGKQFLNIDNEQYLCPDVQRIDNDHNYDGRAIDMWSFGIVMYYCYVGCYPYNVIESKKGSAFWAVMNGKIKHYLGTCHKLKFINTKILKLLNNLLTENSNARLNSADVLKDRLFSKFSI